MVSRVALHPHITGDPDADMQAELAALKRTSEIQSRTIGRLVARVRDLEAAS